MPGPNVLILHGIHNGKPYQRTINDIEDALAVGWWLIDADISPTHITDQHGNIVMEEDVYAARVVWYGEDRGL